MLLLVVADVEREGDDVPGDVGRGQLPLTEFSLRRVAIAWAPFGLQCAGDKRYVLRSMALEILYAPLVLLLGSGLVLYPT